MPDLQSIMVFAVVAAVMVLFITEKLRVDLIALCVSPALIVQRLVDSCQTLYCFANQLTATIAVMFVLSAGLVRTGLVEWLALHLDEQARKTEP